MKATKLKIIQRKRLADSTSQVTENIYKHRVKLIPVFGLLAALAGLVFLRLQPQTSKYVSQLIETSLGAVEHLFVLWSPITLLVALSLAALMYIWMDYKHHKIPLIRINHRVKYNFWHHLHVAFFPRFKYRWRPAFYWMAVAQVSAAVFIATVAVVGVPAAKAFSGSGLGSAEDPYIILNCSQLQEMRDDLDGHYELGGPIDCSDTVNWNGGDGFVGVGGGGQGQGFMGSLDGKGFAVDGLYQRIDDHLTLAGLLGSAENATVNNIKLTAVDIQVTQDQWPVGALAGGMGNSQISDIEVSGSITGNSSTGPVHIGGVLGSLFQSTASRISADITIINNATGDDEVERGSQVGGLTVIAYQSTISDSYATGSISASYGAESTNAMFTGGLVSQLLIGTIQNSYSSISTTIVRDTMAEPSALLVGGLAAMAIGSEINGSFAVGQQNISVGPMVIDFRGGFVGMTQYDPNAGPPMNQNMPGGNNLWDVTATGSSDCIGAYGGEEFGEEAPDQTPPGFCSPVNTGNSQPNYFNNNSSNAPFTVAGSPVWDFTNTWKTQANGPPIFLWQGPQVPALPGQVRNLTSTSASSTNLTAQWLVPVFGGNTPITNYVVQYKLHSDTNWTTVSRSPSATTSQLISGLVAGQMYDIRVAAINAVGQGDWRVTENVSTSQLPAALQTFTVTGMQGTTQFGDFEDFYFPQLNWQVPAEGQPITDYIIQYKVTPGPDWDEVSEDLENDGVPWVTGDWVTTPDGTNTIPTKNSMDNVDPYLTQALIYNVPAELRVVESVEFRVAAVNSYGQGPWTASQNFQVFVGLTACQQMHDMLTQHPGVLFNLLDDINCNGTINWNDGTGWSPIGTEQAPFSGIVDGKGHAISGLYANHQTNPEVAMFAYATDTTIRNLNMDHVTMRSWRESDSGSAAALVAIGEDITLQNINVQNAAVSAASYASGGLVALLGVVAPTVTWNGVTYAGSVSSPGFSGGIVGQTDGNSIHIINASTSGTVMAGSVGGGIVGGSVSSINVSSSTSSMNIKGFSGSIGGLIGASTTSSVVGSSFTGTLTGGTKTNVDYLANPRAMAIDSLGQVYIADITETGIIRKFSPAGTQVAQWSINLPEDPVPNIWYETNRSIRGIAIDSQDRVFVADEAHNEVRIFSSGGQFVDAWDITSTGKIAFDSSDNLYVTGQQYVHKYAPDGTLLNSWNGDGNLGTSLEDIAVAPDGRIFVADSSQFPSRIYVLSSSGSYITQFTSDGNLAGGSGQPVGLAIHGTTLSVAHESFQRVVNFDITSGYAQISFWDASQTSQEAIDIATNTDGDVLLMGTTVKKLQPNGILLDQWSGKVVWYDFTDKPISIGGIAGTVLGSSTLSTTTSSGQITASSIDGGLVGGLIGSLFNPAAIIDPEHPEQSVGQGTLVANSSSSMDINFLSGKIATAGGLIGLGDIFEIRDSQATGYVTVGDQASNLPATGAAGGLVGSASGPITGNTTSAIRIKDSSASGSVQMVSLSKKYNEVRGPLAGGLVGYTLGWVDLSNAYASGDVTINQRVPSEPGYHEVIMIGRAGGAVGAMSAQETLQTPVIVNGVHASGLVTSHNSLTSSIVGGAFGEITVPGIQMQNSYASGNVITYQDDSAQSVSTVGGLAGVTAIMNPSTLESLYATGNVSGSANYFGAGGNGVFVMESVGGLLGTVFGPVSLQKSYATGSVEGGSSVGGLVGVARSILPDGTHNGPLTIHDTYATGDVSGFKTIGNFPEESEFGEGYLELGTRVGGLLGTGEGAAISSSYASGILTNQRPEFSSGVAVYFEYLFGAATGGLVGQVSFGGDVQVPPTDQMVLSNSFSATTMQDTTANVKGLLIGKFMTPQEPGDGSSDIDLTDFIENTYYDIYRSGSLPCANEVLPVAGATPEDVTLATVALNNPSVCLPVNHNNQTPNHFRNNTTNPPLNSWDFTTPVWYQHVTTYPTFQPGETVPGPPRDLGGTPTTSSMVLTWNPPSTDGGSPITDYRIQYRLNGTNDWIEYSHPPSSTITSYTIPGLISGQRYDFQVSALNAVGQSAWVLGIYDVLIPGGSPNNPSNPTNPVTPVSTPLTPTTPRRPTRPTGSTPVATTPTTPIDPTSPEASANTPRHLDVNRLPENLPGLASFARKPSKVNLLPYFFLSWLLLLALYFAYRAWREYRYQQAMVALIANTKATSQAVSNFLAITTHYVNTPLSILKGAIELIASKHSLQPDFVTQFQTKLLGLQTTTTNLVAQAEQGLTLGATAASASPAVTTTTVATTDQQATKQLWLPLLGIASAIAITDIVLLLTKSYGHSWARMLNHLIWAVAGTAIVMVTYWFWKKQKQLQASTRQQLHTERTLLANKNQFLGTAATSLTTHAAQLRVGTAGLEQFPDTKLLTNGLGMLDRLAASLTKAQRFATLSPALPRLNVRQVYQQDIAPALSQQATEAGASLQDNLPADLMLQMQPDELTHILGTTIDNAIQYGGTSTNVSTDTTTNTTPANNTAATNVVQVSGHPGRSKATLTVKDNGSGIAPDIQAHLFEPLTRGTDTATFDHQGLGLNLYLTRLILQKYGGNIHLTSQPKQGTTVTMTMPNSHTDPTGLAPQVVVPRGKPA